MSTILLCWYAMGLFWLGVSTHDEDRLTMKDFSLAMLAAPLLTVIGVGLVLKSEIVLWRRP